MCKSPEAGGLTVGRHRTARGRGRGLKASVSGGQDPREWPLEDWGAKEGLDKGSFTIKAVL
jgi:hypothetical protein